MRDHIVTLTAFEEGGSDSPSSLKDMLTHQVYNDLLAHRDAVCISYQELPGNK